MGRSTLSIQAKRNWMTSVRGAFGTIRSTVTHPTPEELMNVFSLSNINSVQGSRDGNQQTFLGPLNMQPGAGLGGLGLHANPVGSSNSTALSVQPNSSYAMDGQSSQGTNRGSLPASPSLYTPLGTSPGTPSTVDDYSPFLPRPLFLFVPRSLSLSFPRLHVPTSRSHDSQLPHQHVYGSHLRGG